MLLDTIMDQNFMCQDKLKGWVRQLENEITENPLSKHVSHLYAFTKIVEGYQRQMHKLNLLLEPEKWSESAAGSFFAPEEPVLTSASNAGRRGPEFGSHSKRPYLQPNAPGHLLLTHVLTLTQHGLCAALPCAGY